MWMDEAACLKTGLIFGHLLIPNSGYNVFNVDQTNLKEARPELYHKLEEQNQQVRPQVAEGEEFSFKPVDHMIEHNEWICPIKPIHGDNAYYSISKKEIVIPEKSQFKDGESFYSNLFHEMAYPNLNIILTF